MYVALTPDQLRLRDELQGYFSELVTPERRAALAASSGEFGDVTVYKDVIRQLGTDGWLGMGWPEEWGGQNRSMVDELIFTNVAAVAGVPIPYLTLNTVGPTIMRYGTAGAEGVLPPRIVQGELHFSIGYSEPGSGTDLASLRTRGRARRVHRRVGHQRPEDVDLPDPVRRLDLDGVPHRSRPAPPQGPVDDPGPGRRRRASPTRRCTRSPVSAPARPTTTTSGSRPTT